MYAIFGGIGITAGAHRLFAHRAYKAKWPLRVLLMLLNSTSFQNPIYEWVRDHRYTDKLIRPRNMRNAPLNTHASFRVHHKFVDSDADPHNVNRGFFFSHIGWLMIKKHSDVIAKGKSIDMSDLKNDPVIMFQKKYFHPLKLVTAEYF